MNLLKIRDFRGDVDLAVGAPLETINIPKGLYGFEAWAAAFPRNQQFREIVKRTKLQLFRNFSFSQIFSRKSTKIIKCETPHLRSPDQNIWKT